VVVSLLCKTETDKEERESRGCDESHDPRSVESDLTVLKIAEIISISPHQNQRPAALDGLTVGNRDHPHLISERDAIQFTNADRAVETRAWAGTGWHGSAASLSLCSFHTATNREACEQHFAAG